MNIQINKEYSITSDSNQYTLNRHSIVQNKDSNDYGKEVAKPFAYYSRLDHALTRLIDHSVRMSDVSSLYDAIGHMNLIKAEITESFKEK